MFSVFTEQSFARMFEANLERTLMASRLVGEQIKISNVLIWHVLGIVIDVLKSPASTYRIALYLIAIFAGWLLHVHLLYLLFAGTCVEVLPVFLTSVSHQ